MFVQEAGGLNTRINNGEEEAGCKEDASNTVGGLCSLLAVKVDGELFISEEFYLCKMRRMSCLCVQWGVGILPKGKQGYKMTAYKKPHGPHMAARDNVLFTDSLIHESVSCSFKAVKHISMYFISAYFVQLTTTSFYQLLFIFFLNLNSLTSYSLPRVLTCFQYTYCTSIVLMSPLRSPTAFKIMSLQFTSSKRM